MFLAARCEEGIGELVRDKQWDEKTRSASVSLAAIDGCSARNSEATRLGMG